MFLQDDQSGQVHPINEKGLSKNEKGCMLNNTFFPPFSSSLLVTQSIHRTRLKAINSAAPQHLSFMLTYGGLLLELSAS